MSLRHSNSERSMDIRGTSCSTGRERLGLRFTIDYLLYNKGAKNSETVKEKSSSEDLTVRHGTKSIKEGEEEGEDEDDREPPISTEGSQDKPAQSYITLISMAILESEEKKLLLCDIYKWIMEHYPYFKSKDKNWRNSVRHNLSLNECFIKAGRSDNGKGHYWAIHPANLQDFSNGDYHQRRARRRIRRVTGQLSSIPPNSPYYATGNHQRVTGCWCCPPAPGHLLSCLPNRFYWSWIELQARVGYHPALQTSGQYC